LNSTPKDLFFFKDRFDGIQSFFKTKKMIFRRRLFKHIFNHKDWIKRPEERKHMVAYIERKKLLIGLTKEEVILKLSDEFNDPNSDLWSYYVGLRPVLGNKIYFFIYFNKQGIVYQTLRD
jgi:hypothetical protein